MRKYVGTIILFFLSIGLLQAQVTYNGNGNAGFGGVLGPGQFDISDGGTTVTLTFDKGSDDFNDALVVYIDSESGGFANTSNFTDTGDNSRQAVSGFDGSNRSTVNFPTGFRADFAIAANVNSSDDNFGNLFELVENGSHNFVDVVNISPSSGVGNSTYTMTFDFSEINTSSGTKSFSFVATYLNEQSAFRSDEAIGKGLSSFTQGQSTATFDTYFQYDSGDEGGLATTASAGNFSDAATWTNGNVPLEGDAIEINHDVTLNNDATVASVTISSTNTLASEASQGRTLTVNDGGSFTNNGTFTASDGTVSFAGSGTVSGTVTFNNVDYAGGVDFGTGSTINGTATVNASGFVNTNAPTYGNSSTLVYNVDNTTDGPYGRNAEWEPGATTGAGYPNNVQLSNSTVLQLGANGATGSTFQIAGNFIIDAGSSLDMNNPAMTEALTVKGNFTNNGSVTLSSSGGGDLKLEGNFDDNGTFTANSRAVFFEGGNDQNINSTTDPLDIDVMRIGKSGGSVIMNQNLTADATADPLQFSTANSILDLNGNSLTIGSGTITSAIDMVVDSGLRGSSASTLIINGEGDLGTLRFDQTTPGTTNILGTLTINRDASGSITIGNDLVVETEGTVETSNSLTLDGELTINGSFTMKPGSDFDDNGNTITGDITFEQEITNGNEFVLFASPTTSTTFNEIVEPLWTQGMTGADAPNDGNPNVYSWDNNSTGSSETNWSGLSNLGDQISDGTGFLTYVFADTDFNGSANTFPINVSTTGGVGTGTISPTINGNDEGFTLVGNPYGATIDFDNLNTTELTDVAYVWNPATDQWDTSPKQMSTGELTGGLIAPFQGFFVQTANSATNPGLDFVDAAKATGATFRDKSTGEKPLNVRLELNGIESDLMNSTWLSFSENGSLSERAAGDALKLKSLSNNFTQLATTKSGNDDLLDINHLPNEFDDKEELPLVIPSNVSGTFTLSATDFNLPEGLSLTFNNLQTGESIPMGPDFETTIEVTADRQNKASAEALVSAPEKLTQTGSAAAAYGITIEPDVITSVDDGRLDVPSEVELQQNFPNPFNPSTTIQYALPEQAQVNLTVYDMLGQQVAQLLSGQVQSAGSHSINFDASNLSSGMYIYRLQAGSQSITRKMILLK